MELKKEDQKPISKNQPAKEQVEAKKEKLQNKQLIIKIKAALSIEESYDNFDK